MGTIGKRRNTEEERKKEWKNKRKGLTLTGLLMEGALITGIQIDMANRQEKPGFYTSASFERKTLYLVQTPSLALSSRLELIISSKKVQQMLLDRFHFSSFTNHWASAFLRGLWLGDCSRLIRARNVFCSSWAKAMFMDAFTRSDASGVRPGNLI
jgi:hypothetical protein